MSTAKKAELEPRKFIKELEILEDSFELGVQIYNSGFRPTFIVGLWRGGSSVGIYVQECLQYLGVETDHISIRTSYRGISTYQQMVDNPDSDIRVHGTQYLLDTLNSEDRLLIVDDVFSSGLTINVLINRLTQRLKRNMPEAVRVAVPWYKPRRRKTERVPDYYLHETEHWLVMPYELVGLTDKEILENKPYMEQFLRS